MWRSIFIIVGRLRSWWLFILRRRPIFIVVGRLRSWRLFIFLRERRSVIIIS